MFIEFYIIYNQEHTMTGLKKTFIPVLAVSLIFSAGCGKGIYNAAIKSERHSAGVVKKTITVDDHRIAYLEGGTGPTLLLVHGYASDKDFWARTAARLTDKYHVIALDLPGCGESSRIQQDRYDINSQTDRLYRFTQTIGIQKFHLAGHSMGGCIAGHFAVKYPQQVDKLCLISAAGVAAPSKSELDLAMEQGQNPLLIKDEQDYSRLLKFLMEKQPYIPGAVRSEYARSALENKEFNEKIWADIAGLTRMLEPELQKISQPTLILWGDKDRVLDVSCADVFNRGIKSSRKHIIKNCGHGPMIEYPDETAGAILSFLQ